MAAKKKAGITASYQEVTWAQEFLRGISADWHNFTLVQAVIAWFHTLAPKGYKHIPGNNLFGVRDARGNLIRYHTLAQAIEGATKFITTHLSTVPTYLTPAQQKKFGEPANMPSGFALLVKAAQLGSAKDFLDAILASAWGSATYTISVSGNQAYTMNDLYAAFNAITSLTTAPATKGHATSTVPARPAVPILQPPQLHTEFMDPFRAESFYRARHEPYDSGTI